MRWARRSATQILGAGGAGLTLVELLIAVVIIGMLGGIVSFAVGNLHAKARSSACASERATLQAALESYRVMHGVYAGETELVAAGLLRGESTAYDVAVSDHGYTLTPVGGCAEAADGAAPDPATTVSTAGTPTVPIAATTTTPPLTTTTVPPRTSTSVATTTVPAHALTLVGVCTPRQRWHDERAWQVGNANSTAVNFVLKAENASLGWANPIQGVSPPGSSTWYLPVAKHGPNIATLEAAGDWTSVTSANRKC